MRLPGFDYDGDDPDGFLQRDGIVSYLTRYSDSFSAPVREGVRVDSLEGAAGGRFLLRTSAGEVTADSVVLATGAYQRPHRAAIDGAFPPDLLVVDAEGYTEPGGIPDGRVLVVGSGQTGCQIAEELHQAGREVFLACGKTAWLPRRASGVDVFRWLVRTPFFEAGLGSLPSPLARLAGNPQMSGHEGGHDVHYRTLQAMGVRLLGRLTGVDGRRARFAPDLAASVAFGDARYLDICRLLVEQLPDPPPLPEPTPFRGESVTELDLAGFGAVIFTSGFRPDYASWVRFPAFDEMGFPLASECASTVAPGLYFAGVHFLRKRKSSLLMGVGEDAAIVARALVDRHSGATAR